MIMPPQPLTLEDKRKFLTDHAVYDGDFFSVNVKLWSLRGYFKSKEDYDRAFDFTNDRRSYYDVDRLVRAWEEKQSKQYHIEFRGRSGGHAVLVGNQYFPKASNFDEFDDEGIEELFELVWDFDWVIHQAIELFAAFVHTHKISQVNSAHLGDGDVWEYAYRLDIEDVPVEEW